MKMNSFSAGRLTLPGRNRQNRYRTGNGLNIFFFVIIPKGLHFERWQHRHGCRQWFNVVRHTLSHEIQAVYRLDEARPDTDPEEMV